MNRHRTRLRTGLIALVAISLVICPLAAGGFGLAGANAQIAFTPNISPLELTQTAEVTPLGALRASAATVTPLPAPAQETSDALRAPSCVSATEDTIGYDFLGGSDPPLWRICFGGEVLIVGATDSETVNLLDEFTDAADRRATAERMIAQARGTLVLAAAGFEVGAGGVVGGALTAAASCATTPFVGVTVIGCVGGGITALAGLGAMGVSGVAGLMAGRDLVTYLASRRASAGEAEQYFRALQERSSH
jgi:hypothetical protein